MSALLADLQAKGLLDQTLVVLGTEFGPKPWINDNDGRDHHNMACDAFTVRRLIPMGVRPRVYRVNTSTIT